MSHPKLINPAEVQRFLDEKSSVPSCILACVERWMGRARSVYPAAQGVRQTMRVYLTSEGLLTTVARNQRQQGECPDRVITSRDEWEAIGSAWPLKRLVEIWNGLPGVTLVQKFTNRQIALERIWRVITGPEPVHRKAAAEAQNRKSVSAKARKQHRVTPYWSAAKE